MSKNKKKKLGKELIAVVCVLAVLAGGVWYLRTQQNHSDTQNAEGTSGENAAAGAEEGVASGSTSETAERGSAEDVEESSTVENQEDQVSETPAATAAPTDTPTPEPTLSPEEKLAGDYREVGWAQVIGEQILVCQMDAIEVRDSANQIVKNYTDLGQLSLGGDSVYTNGYTVYYASVSDTGSRSIWQLDLETGEKKEMVALENSSVFAGANREYLYYIVSGADDFENTLKAYRISDGTVLDIAQNVDEVTVLSDVVITMGLRFDVSPVALKVCGLDGSNSVTIGEYVNSYLVSEGRIYYLDYGSEAGYIPVDLKSCSRNGQEVQVLAEDLNTLSFSMAGENTIFFASVSEGTDTADSGYLFYNWQTGEQKKAADSGTYLGFLGSDGQKAYLEREEQVAVYDMAAGQFQEGAFALPEGCYPVEGLFLNGEFWVVQSSSDNRIDLTPLGG